MTQMTPKKIALIIIISLFALFIIQNTRVVEISFLFWEFDASRALVLLITFALGLISGVLATLKFKSKESSE